MPGPQPSRLSLVEEFVAALGRSPTAAKCFGNILGRKSSTRTEQAALARVEKDLEERLRWSYYGTLPKSHWRKMSGRQNRVLDDQSDLHGIPLRGDTIQLSEAIRWIHDFLAEKKSVLATEDGPNQPGRRAKAIRDEIAELDLEERRGNLIRSHEVRKGLAHIAVIFRDAGDQLLREYGEGPYGIFESMLSEADAMITKTFSNGRTKQGR